jgi:tRNA(fMet)-specific endonuclease VapC
MTQAILVDTDVISFALRHDTRAGLFLPLLSGKQLCVSFMTLAELDYWALRRRWGSARRGDLVRYLEGVAVLPCDEVLCHTWAEVTFRAERGGRPISCADAWIAATALHYSLPLVTNNAGHFADITGLTVHGPA